MSSGSLAEALGQEHHEIDAGIAGVHRRTLGPAAAGRLRVFLGSGELPGGWVCMLKARSVPGSPGRAGR